jgi:1-acyl-sn-glycerol-3-phosphate acyltransferase
LPFLDSGGLATSLLDDGVPLLLFPEGTRSRTGEMGSFKPGAAAVHHQGRALPADGHRRRQRGDAVRRELARTRAPTGLSHLREADAGGGRRIGGPVLHADAKEVRELVDYTMTYRADHG